MTDSETMSEQRSALPSRRLAQGRDACIGQALIHSHLSHTSKWGVRLLPLWFTPGCEPNEVTPRLFGETGNLFEVFPTSSMFYKPTSIKLCVTLTVYLWKLSYLTVDILTLKNVFLKWCKIHESSHLEIKAVSIVFLCPVFNHHILLEFIWSLWENQEAKPVWV